ncbi:MAG TPA: hypothetical protein VHW47_00960, partial [Acidimicrobiales bacterium]|nr:hypothetical protein [Acidimicrobiales bacterium]
MSPRPPEDFPAEGGAGEPSVEELRALDAFLDALAASTPEPVPAAMSVDPALAATARRLDRLPAAIWESAAPLYQPPAPVIEIDRRPDGSRRRPGRSPARQLGRPLAAVAWAAAAAAVVVVLAVVGINTFSGQPPTRPVTGVSAVPATWRLAGFIDQAAWQATPSGALSSSVGVTCPAAGTCYADNPGSGQGSAVVEVTTDGGTTWTGSVLPAGSWVTSNLACPTVGWCLAAGDAGVPAGSASPLAGTPSTFVTTDGGTTWLVQRIPGVVQPVAATCSSPGSCVVAGLGTPTVADPEGPPVAVRTVDGGGSWSVAALPGSFAPARLNGLSCTAIGDCVV